MEICAFDLQVQIFYLKSQNYPSTKEKKNTWGRLRGWFGHFQNCFLNGRTDPFNLRAWFGNPLGLSLVLEPSSPHPRGGSTISLEFRGGQTTPSIRESGPTIPISLSFSLWFIWRANVNLPKKNQGIFGYSIFF